MSNYNENINKAYEIKNGTASYIVATLESLRDDKSKIRNNRNLSEEGKRAEIAKLNKAYERTFLGEMNRLNGLYHNFLNEGQDAAEGVLTTQLPPVDERKQQLFDIALKKAQGELAFAIGTNQAFSALTELVNAADEPLLAKQARDAFLNLSEPVLTFAKDGGERAALKDRLGGLYSQLESKAQVEGAHEARAALEAVNAMKGASFATGYVQEALKEISSDTAKYVNNPKEYFERNAVNNQGGNM